MDFMYIFLLIHILIYVHTHIFISMVKSPLKCLVFEQVANQLPSSELSHVPGG